MNSTDSRHIPPQAIDAEMSVLGAVFVDSHAITAALETITVGDFYREAHRKIFRSMLELHETKSPIDFVTTSETLRNRGELEEIGGAAYLLTLVDFVPTSKPGARWTL